MQVFISWSGKKSEEIARELKGWLKTILQNLNPVFSSVDIDKGSRSEIEIYEMLKDSSSGIIILTEDNLDSPWIHFEAGALASKVTNPRVRTLLFGLTYTDVQKPLASFQHTIFEKEDFLKFILSLNKDLGDLGIEKEQLEKTFNAFWKEFFDKISEFLKQDFSTKPKHKKRSEREILEEILLLVRGLGPSPILNLVSKNKSGPMTILEALTHNKETASDYLETVLYNRFIKYWQTGNYEITKDGIKSFLQAIEKDDEIMFFKTKLPMQFSKALSNFYETFLFYATSETI